MKLLVFAHTPPPHHGQSFMVQQLVRALGEGAGIGGIELFHVDARLSRSIDDIGGAGLAKVGKLLGFCSRAIWLRLRHGVDTLYYVPAPPKRAALYRDWMVMALCRPFFKRLVFHWHAVGLGQWVEGKAEHLPAPQPWERWLTHRLLGGADLSIVLGESNRGDAQVLAPRAVAVVPNGIPDPCPDFEAALAERAVGARDGLLRVLYLSHCTREKGLFDAISAVKLANSQLGGGAPIRLTVAGEFLDPAEREQFDAELDDAIDYIGFVGGEGKRSAMCGHDCLCFPTYYSGESFGLVLVEAMAFGLTPLASDWRSVGELARHAGLDALPTRNPEALATALLDLVRRPRPAGEGRRLRQHFLENYTIGRHVEGIAAALDSL